MSETCLELLSNVNLRHRLCVTAVSLVPDKKIRMHGVSVDKFSCMLTVNLFVRQVFVANGVSVIFL